MLAFERLSQIIPWFADPPDEWHIEAATALVKICAGSRDLGEAVARVPWVNDGIQVDEIRLTRYLRDRAHNDPTAEVVQGRYWFHVSGGEREVHLEMLVLVAHGARRNPDLIPVLYDLPQIAGSALDDYWMGRDWIQVADRSVEAALTATAFVSANESAGGGFAVCSVPLGDRQPHVRTIR